ncbi:TM2 domain-containing membrane protein YozV [Paraburkholderia sp. BL17N1]|nr:TM2 domain-containing membrane protein YozV [Paraburkholderia sp. BL17N1]
MAGVKCASVRAHCALLLSTACHSALAYMSTLVSTSPRFRSKTITAALAFFFGSLGAHRFYLYGMRDIYGWAHVLGTLIGIPGAMLLVASERASTLGWVLAFPGAISLIAAFLAAIVYGLRPDEKWDAQFNAQTQRKSRSGWTVIFIVIFSLLIGAFLLMTGLAISFQTYFESQVQAAKALSQ